MAFRMYAHSVCDMNSAAAVCGLWCYTSVICLCFWTGVWYNFSGEGVNPSQKSDDSTANTALHVASRAGHHQIVMYLIQVDTFFELCFVMFPPVFCRFCHSMFASYFSHEYYAVSQC